MKGYKNQKRSRQKYNWFNVQNEQRAKWESLCPVGEYRILPSSVLAGVLPNELINQYANVFIMASGTSSGNVYYMANGNRLDQKDGAIDQMPFGFGFVGNDPIASGTLIQHGNWDERSTYPPKEFWLQVESSGFSNYFPSTEMPAKPSGKITDLKIASQEYAFRTIVNALKKQVGE
jgi:hypothetical protein